MGDDESDLNRNDSKKLEDKHSESNTKSDVSIPFNNNEMELVLDGLKDTLRYMKYREALRFYYGAVVNYSYGYAITLVTLYILFVVSLTQFSAQFGHEKQDVNNNFLSEPNNLIHMFVYGCYIFSIISSWISSYPKTFVSTTRLTKIFFVFYIISIPIVILYNLNKNTGVLLSSESIFNLRLFALYKGFFIDTIILFFYSIILLLINILALFYHFVYRHLILKWINQDICCYRITYKQVVTLAIPNTLGFKQLVKGFHTVGGDRSTGISLVLEYVDRLPWYKEILPNLLFNIGRVAKTNHPCRYVGQVDPFNRPHGFGFWKSTSYYGEVLVGFWENGKPIGAFKARDVGTGSGFSNILIGWAKCDFDPNSMKIGVASAECCVSGAFFRTFPRILLYEASNIPIGDINYYVVHKTLEVPTSYNVDENNRAIFGKKPKFQTPDGIVLSLSHVSNDLNKMKYSMRFNDGIDDPFIKMLQSNNEDVKIKPSRKISLQRKIRKGRSIINYLRNRRNSKHTSEKSSCIASLDAVLSSMCPHSPIFVSNRLNSITVSSNLFGIDIHGHTMVSNELKDYVTIRIDNEKILSVDGWVPSEMTHSFEVWIFIHGFNTSCTDSMVLMGQMSAFGNFPPYIKPIIFSWPSENSVFKFFKAQDNACNEIIHSHFKLFIESLYENGIRNLHIMSHSMGTRMFIKSFSKMRGLFNKFDKSDPSRMNLLTITLISPEYDLDTFISRDFSMLRKYCSIITIFSDLRDKALITCEKLTRTKVLGRRVFEVFSKMDLENISNSSDNSVDDLNEEVDQIKDMENKRRFLDNHTVTIADLELPKQLNSTGMKVESRVDGNPKRSIFKHYSTMSNFEVDRNDIEHKNWLDVDVIDTTWLGSNINNIRHTFWILNREIIEDIRELIVYKKRACQRTGRLDRREGNVWVYRVAPQDVKSVFV